MINTFPFFFSLQVFVANYLLGKKSVIVVNKNPTAHFILLKKKPVFFFFFKGGGEEEKVKIFLKDAYFNEESLQNFKRAFFLVSILLFVFFFFFFFAFEFSSYN